MESEILNLIQTDQKTREAVEEAHRMKFELKRKIADTEKQISEDAWKEVHQRVDAKKAELDYQISQVESENLKEYEQELKRLQAHYLEKKEELTNAYSSTPDISSAPAATAVEPSASKLDWKEQKEEKARERKRQNELKKTEERITALEERDQEIDELMTQEEVFTNSVRCQELAVEKAGIAEELEELYLKWEELAE